jgi:hypothetical protein
VVVMPILPDEHADRRDAFGSFSAATANHRFRATAGKVPVQFTDLGVPSVT